MSVTFYVRDPNGTIFSEDRKTRYREIAGSDIGAFLETPEGKSRIFYLFASKKGTHAIEAPPELRKKYNCEDQRLRDRNKRNVETGVVVFSLSTLLEDGENTLLDTIPDKSVDVAGDVEKKILHAYLRHVVSGLPRAERELIESLYLKDEPMTEREYSDFSGIPQKTINDRKRRILKRLQIFLEK